MTGFFASTFPGAGGVALGFEEAPFAEEDLDEPRAPETVPAREARDGALDEEALEPAPFGTEDLDVGTLEAMKISEDDGFPRFGKSP
jgi:hypothetical protein